MRVIDGDALTRQFCADCGRDNENKNCRYDCAIYDLISNFPTIYYIADDDKMIAHWNKRKIKNYEKTSVKRLFKNGYAYECSNCLLCEPYNHIGQYCRGCGCKMEGVRDESERND